MFNLFVCQIYVGWHFSWLTKKWVEFSWLSFSSTRV